ncbi:ABC transporter periplasmic component [Microbacterium keratanolyticum]|uniref:ABC transporter periplasmic component n=1 Tax=Microbacterium keratanolyticum TaxID=67574 RepID=A0A9W6HQC4_9MICO|nr:ABC transporter periplasmic component [Microbacterium keratanolyticum]
MSDTGRGDHASEAVNFLIDNDSHVRYAFRVKKPAITLVTVALTALVLTGCAPFAAETVDDGTIDVVTTTNVYGDLAAHIGGDRVTVTALIDSAAKDPHSYEASARDRLTVQGADLVIENGGGYDAFMHDLLDGSTATVLTAVEYSHDFPGNETHEEDADAAHDEAAHDAESHDEHAHDHGDHEHIEGFNEHVWFDPHTVSHLVDDIARTLTELDPERAETFAANAAELQTDLEGFEAQLAQLKTDAAGAGVFVTEPVPGYLAVAAGLTDLAPEGFAAAVEEGRDVPPAMLLNALDVIASGDVKAVLSNAQTGGAETERIETAARDAGIPVVGFREILPKGTTYSEWMTSAIDSLVAALTA